MRKIHFLSSAAGIAAVLTTLSLPPAPALAQRIDPDNAAWIEQGARNYAKHCASCHGANLEGEKNWQQRKKDGTLPAPPHDATGHTWHHPDQMLFFVTKMGGQAVAPPSFKSAMPGFKDVMTDEEIWAVLSFIKSRWPEKIKKTHDRLNERMRHTNH
ncbi:MAG: cytochrome c [Rhodospirillales bacterium]